MIVVSILVFLLILTVIVTLHEAGHFMMAKKFGVYCKEFAIGMGPKIWKRQTEETMYSIRAIPMGGYVQMMGEDGEFSTLKVGDVVWLGFEGDVITRIAHQKPTFTASEVTIVRFDKSTQPMRITYFEAGTEKTAMTSALVQYFDHDNQEQDLVATNRQFNALPPLKKIAILVAGVMMNFLLALVVVVVATWIGGVQVDPIIASDSMSETAQRFEVNDRILKIDEHPFEDVETLTTYVREHAGQPVTVTVERSGQQILLQRTIKQAETQQLSSEGIVPYTYGILGVTYQRNHINLIKIFQVALESFIGFFQYVALVLGGLFTGKIAITNLTGFVGIAQQTDMMLNVTTASTTPFTQFMEIFARILNFTAFLSVNIGVMNVLPFPALDGGRVVFALYELIFRKKPNPKFETYFNAFGFMVLIALFIGVTFLDIKRLLAI